MLIKWLALKSIPAIQEPFSQVVIDCVGPLLRTKVGNQCVCQLVFQKKYHFETLRLLIL